MTHVTRYQPVGHIILPSRGDHRLGLRPSHLLWPRRNTARSARSLSFEATQPKVLWEIWCEGRRLVHAAALEAFEFLLPRTRCFPVFQVTEPAGRVLLIDAEGDRLFEPRQMTAQDLREDIEEVFGSFGNVRLEYQSRDVRDLISLAGLLGEEARPKRRPLLHVDSNSALPDVLSNLPRGPRFQAYVEVDDLDPSR